MLFENFLQLKNPVKHHAVLFISKQFEQYNFPNEALFQFSQKMCNIQISNIDSYHPDILIIDRTRNQLLLEDVEKIKDFCLYPPQLGTHRLIFIEKCERLNLNSANFILKSLEEPPAQVIFLFTSAYKHLLLSTILSRVQTVPIALPALNKKKFIEEFDGNAVEFVKTAIFNLNPKKVFFGKSLSDSKNFYVKPTHLASLLTQCEQLAKSYTGEELRSLIVYWVSERLKKEKTFVIIARFIMAHIRAWKRAEPLNPSSQFWLLRIFLGHTHYENNANR